MVAVMTQGRPIMDDGDDIVIPSGGYGTLAERRERRANVHRLFTEYLRADSDGVNVIKHDPNTDKITDILLHPHLMRRHNRLALITHFMALTKRQRDVWLAVEFGVVRDRGSDGQWERRYLHPHRHGGLSFEETADYYHLELSTVREYHRLASAEMALALPEVRPDR
jgi:hypothetical protein